MHVEVRDRVFFQPKVAWGVGKQMSNEGGLQLCCKRGVPNMVTRFSGSLATQIICNTQSITYKFLEFMGSRRGKEEVKQESEIIIDMNKFRPGVGACTEGTQVAVPIDNMMQKRETGIIDRYRMCKKSEGEEVEVVDKKAKGEKAWGAALSDGVAIGEERSKLRGNWNVLKGKENWANSGFNTCAMVIEHEREWLGPKRTSGSNGICNNRGPFCTAIQSKPTRPATL
ncbi:uncharacterized protein EI90DRAFT_3021509 [Cantharellus anzutake]|uniref:uncharacterized protein n=1 Tax=Cantharellus anzutake TaxID=1750568 RepID=UPI0019039C49|nr:uncharacterized protein EI90DRAFT_3021509 [Cantharellus anzutake]KAF8316695.1 hypothetical protein EI90DRAFT_3021509 [Cantharellus anzutake]